MQLTGSRLNTCVSASPANKHDGLRLLVLLLALILSASALHHAGRLHPDEAFYLTFARDAAVRGDWLMIGEPVDKPPLTFYGNALALVLFAVKLDAGDVHQLDALQGEFAGRMQAWFFSILFVALIMRLSYTLFHDRRAALLAGCLAALSPLRIVFAATAFTDLPMLTLTTAGLWVAAAGRPVWSGGWMALAFAAKPQAIFLFPLLLIQWRRWRGAWCFVLPMVLCFAVLALWDQARMQQGAASFWALGAQRYPPLRITDPAEWGARFAELWSAVGYLFGHPLLTAGFGSVALLAGIGHSKGRMLSGWIVLFVLAHVMLSLNLYDRNLIVLLPAAALLGGLLLSQTVGRDSNKGLKPLVRDQIPAGEPLARPYVCYALMGVMLLAAVIASTGALPIGGDDGRHAGIDQLAAALNSKPVATVIYDRWLDWELDYYMGVWTDKRRVYYHTPEEMVSGALALEESGIRYFIVPSWETADRWIAALETGGFRVWLDAEISGFQMYALQPPG